MVKPKEFRPPGKVPKKMMGQLEISLHGYRKRGDSTNGREIYVSSYTVILVFIFNEREHKKYKLKKKKEKSENKIRDDLFYHFGTSAEVTKSIRFSGPQIVNFTKSMNFLDPKFSNKRYNVYPCKLPKLFPSSGTHKVEMCTFEIENIQMSTLSIETKKVTKNTDVLLRKEVRQ
ncbi:hypothetical protein M0802_005871 [Mischocyttarus mexicanus]|nr:hypothetical protein M0802_005871 [Mischocyttarus mexicanus]